MSRFDWVSPSTCRGHIAPSTTYWYLFAVPELIDIVADQLDVAQADQ